ncbi:MAG: phosphoribosylformylglycinamidine synthase subunit PurS [Vicingaceae bacterium]|nr:MAG: phosphoribosylformylglycinamidine synthase subunit PurS [Vicingaceae bacterium]
MKFLVSVKVMPHKALLDPQGKAVLQGLQNLGLTQTTDVRIGKNIELTIEATDENQALAVAGEAAKKLLANPVMEYYELEIKQLTETH